MRKSISFCLISNDKKNDKKPNKTKCFKKLSPQTSTVSYERKKDSSKKCLNQELDNISGSTTYEW